MLTEAEINAIREEAENYAAIMIWTNKSGEDDQLFYEYISRESYIAALTKERERAKQQPPTVKEEQTTTDVKQVAKEMACKFMAWYVDDPNEEVTKALMELPVDNLIEDVYDYWLIKYFNPETIVSTVPNKTNK